MGNALFASMCLFSDYAGNKVIVLAILGKGLNVRSHIYIYIICIYRKRERERERHRHRLRVECGLRAAHADTCQGLDYWSGKGTDPSTEGNRSGITHTMAQT